MTSKTGFLFHEICMWHNYGADGTFVNGAPYIQPTSPDENPETKRRIKNLLDVSGVIDGLTSIKAKPASYSDLTRFHTERYLTELQEVSKTTGGSVGYEALLSQGGYEIACQSAGMAMQAVESVLTGEVKNAYSLNRPPGHHALADEGMGFCLLGNIPIAIEAAIAKNLVKRVAVLDWDVHHGNGTESAFYDRNDVLTISIHQDNNFPLDSGAYTATGSGAGEGFNLNIPLQAGSGIGAYQAAMDELVLPALERFKPEIIIVACGFDASALDPLGHMMLNSQCYRDMTQKLMELADTVCDGKLVFVHEGGYSETYVPLCGLAVIETLSQQRSQIPDPIGGKVSQIGQQALQPHQAELIQHLKQFFKL